MRNLKEKLPNQGGFTIIEVVLVLAIAGLIFLIVFLALPQLQQSRRDTQKEPSFRFLYRFPLALSDSVTTSLSN